MRCFWLVLCLLRSVLFDLLVTELCSPDERGEGGQSLKDDILAGAREADYASNPAIWCLGGCLCLILSLYIAFIIWAVAAIASSLEVTETDCGVVYNLWWFNAIGLFGALLVVLQSMFRQPALGVVGALIYLVLAICGVLMWSRMSERCDMWFSQNYFDLFLLFKINTVFYCVFFCCSCGLLVRCVLPNCFWYNVSTITDDVRNFGLQCSSAMGMLGGNHREGSFSDIPGANSAENLEEELRRAAGNGDVPEVCALY